MARVIGRIGLADHPKARAVSSAGTSDTVAAMTQKKVAVFWPGDARRIPNELATPNAEEATQQLEKALTKLGRTPYRVPGFL